MQTYQIPQSGIVHMTFVQTNYPPCSLQIVNSTGLDALKEQLRTKLTDAEKMSFIMEGWLILTHLLISQRMKSTTIQTPCIG